MRIRRCPNCKSFDVHRSRRSGWFETSLLHLFLLQPYRCHACCARHYGFVFEPTASFALRKMPNRHSARLRGPILQRISFVLILVCVPILLANSRNVMGRLGKRPLPAGVQASQVARVVPTAASQVAARWRAGHPSDVVTGFSGPALPMDRTADVLGRVVSSSQATINGNALLFDAAIFPGDSISVGSGGTALVSFSRSGVAALAEGTKVRFSGDGGSIMAEMLSGGLQVAWETTHAFVVNTSEYRVEPRGEGKAEFRVAVTPDNRTLVEAQHGQLTITRLGSGETFTLANGVSGEIPPSASGVPAQEEEQSPPIGTVLSSIAATRGGAPLPIGATISDRDLVATGAAGGAVIQLSPKTKVSLRQNTSARFTRNVERIWVQLTLGEVVADSTGESYPVVVTPRFYVEPNSAEHSIIYVEVMADNSTYIESAAGDVRIEAIQSGQAFVLPSGHSSLIPANSSGVPGLQPRAPVPAATPTQTTPPAPSPAPSPSSAPQPSVAKASSHRTLIILGIAAAAGTAGAVAALAGGGHAAPVASPSAPL